ncbi:MAG TPA: hypothetical protein VFA30_02890 [Gaiellaceae bacterium]|nr:hypothetical protein [Gaiellaceae bacterium]
MRAPPDGLATDTVAAALCDGWGIEAELAYAPVGAGSYHWHAGDVFVTVDDLDQKAWLGRGRDVVFANLRAAFDTAAELRAAGLDFVVAPVPGRAGEALRRLGDRHSIAVFPFLDGAAGEFGVYESGADRLAVTGLLARLHGTPARSAPAPGLALPGRAHLDAALAQLDRPWTGGPLSEPARDAVRQGAGELAALLDLADRLAAVSLRGPLVVTHGEPHAANVIRAGEGRFLLDWDTVALAPAERDLWLLAEPDSTLADAYAELTGRALDGRALDYYRLAWDLKDWAEYLNVLRSPHGDNDDTRRSLHALARIGDVHAGWL